MKCPSCKSDMEEVGHGSYQCESCGIRDDSEFVEEWGNEIEQHPIKSVRES